MRQPPTELKRDKTSNRAYVRWQRKKYYFGTFGSRKANQAFAKWLHELYSDPSIVSDSSTVTIEDCIDRYLDFAMGYYTEEGEPSQEFRNIHAAMQSLDDYIKIESPAADFGPKKLKAIQSALIDEMTQPKEGDVDFVPKRKYARSTINSRINRIRRCFRWCASEQMIPSSVIEALDTVSGLSEGRTEVRESDPVTEVPVDVVIRTLPYLSRTVSGMVRVQMLCGMRPQDVCRMSENQIDMTGDVWLYKPLKHKTRHKGKTLTKAVPASAQAILNDFRRADPGEPYFSTDDSLEFWRAKVRKTAPKAGKTQARRPYTSGSYGKAIVYAIERAAREGVIIPHWSPNQLRHSIATQVRASLGIEAAQLFLGHAKVDTTLIYAEKSAKALAEIARQLISPFDDEPPKREPQKS